MNGTNRRDFLKLAAMAGASAAASGAAPAQAANDGARGANSEAPPGAVRAWRTSKSEKFAPLASPPEWKPWAGASATAIELDPSVLRQEVLGFGGAFTDASCYLFHQMPPESRRALLSDLFGPQGLRLSVCRTCIGSSDYSTRAYSYDDSSTPDPELKKFSIRHDTQWILPTLREAREINPELFLFSSPWSPPGWMKPNRSMLGGCMDRTYFASYAQYFVKFLRAYAAAGVKIQAVTVQNEVDTNQDGKMPAALWGQEYEIQFIRDHLSPALKHAGLDTKIWFLDHNYDLWGRAVDELSYPGVHAAVDGVAWHGYAGTPDAMSRVHDTFPAKHAYWTEGGPHLGPEYATNWAKWSGTFAQILRNWPRCIVSWNLLLDENGKPNIGPFSSSGLVTINSQTRHLTRSGQYYAFAHYSKPIARGARIMASWGGVPGLDHLAARNPDGGRALVVTNRNPEDLRVQCRLGVRSLDLSLPPDSITTLTW